LLKHKTRQINFGNTGGKVLSGRENCICMDGSELREARAGLNQEKHVNPNPHCLGI
jgi:hypothetical protein